MRKKKMRTNRIIILIIGFICSVQTIFAQGAAGDKASIESQRIIDMPTAGMLAKGTYSVNTNCFTPGGIMVDFQAALFKNFHLGVAFSGTGIVGRSSMKFQNMPGFSIKFRVLDEERNIPAIAIGFNSQGRGAWIKSLKRFETMSPGFFLAVSKNFSWALGNIAAHGGLNYSVEPNSDNKNVNFYAGCEQSLGSRLAINFEYNFNLDEKNYDILENCGMLNSSIRYSIADGVTLELELRDLLGHIKASSGKQIERRLNLEIVRAF